MSLTGTIIGGLLGGAVALIASLLFMISQRLDEILREIKNSNGWLERLRDSQKLIRENQQEAIGLLEKIDQSQR